MGHQMLGTRNALGASRLHQSDSLLGYSASRISVHAGFVVTSLLWRLRDRCGVNETLTTTGLFFETSKKVSSPLLSAFKYFLCKETLLPDTT